MSVVCSRPRGSYQLLCLCVKIVIPGEGGLRGQGRGCPRHPHQGPSDQVRRPRLLSHPEEHRSQDAEEGDLTAAGG